MLIDENEHDFLAFVLPACPASIYVQLLECAAISDTMRSEMSFLAL